MFIFIYFALVASGFCDQGDPFNTFQDVTGKGVFTQKLGQQIPNTIYQGYIPIDWYFPKTKSSIFYQLVAPLNQNLQAINPETPVIFYWEGGPGCSSQWGSYGEYGPMEFDDKGKLVLRENTLAKENWLVFADQPLGTGFSYTEANQVVNTTFQASKHIMNFLYHFYYDKHVGLSKNPIYFFGESYGGHYVPYFAFEFLRNSNFSLFQFKGVAIGDPWTDTAKQNFDFGSIYLSTGIIGGRQKKAIISQEMAGLTAITQGDYYTATLLSDGLTDMSYYGNPDVLNFKNYDSDDGPDPYEAFLQNKDLQKQLNIPPEVSFYDNNQTIYEAFRYDIALNFLPQVEFLLQRVKVMIYQGQNDYIVPLASVQKMINQIKWDGLDNWKLQTKKAWKVLENSEIVGNYKCYDSFTFVVVYDAGHLVPFDQLDAAIEMFNRFLHNAWVC